MEVRNAYTLRAQPTPMHSPKLLAEIEALRAKISLLEARLEAVTNQLAMKERKTRADEVMRLLHQPVPEDEARSIKDVVRVVCAVWNVTHGELVGPGRRRSIAWPRQAAFWLARHHCQALSYPQIARHFGKRDHTTIMHGLRVVEQRLAADADFAAEVAAARAMLREATNG